MNNIGVRKCNMSEMKVCYYNFSCNTGHRAHWTSPAHPCFTSTRSTLDSGFMKTILNLQCWLICESLSVSAAYTVPKCLQRKIIWHGCDHKPQTSGVIPGTHFSNFQRLISQDDIYIDVLMSILSNF